MCSILRPDTAASNGSAASSRRLSRLSIRSGSFPLPDAAEGPAGASSSRLEDRRSVLPRVHQQHGTSQSAYASQTSQAQLEIIAQHLQGPEHCLAMFTGHSVALCKRSLTSASEAPVLSQLNAEHGALPSSV